MSAIVKKKTKVLIMVPVFQSVYPLPFQSFLCLLASAASKEHDHYEFSVHVAARQMVHMAMNRITAAMLADGFDALIVMDDDCLPPPNAISVLLRHYEAGREFVAGLGYMRNPPYTTTIGRQFPEGISICNTDTGETKLAGFHWVDDVSQEPDLIPCDFCGLPIAMIAASAFRKIEAPWFGTFIDGGDCTHDVYFAHKARAVGIQPYVDKTIPSGHQADPPIINQDSRDFNRAAVRAFTATRNQAVTE